MLKIQTKNFDKALLKIEELKERYSNKFESIVYEIAEKIRDYIKNKYISTKSSWQENNGNLSLIDGADVIVVNKGTSYSILIGSQSPLFVMPERSEQSAQQYQGLPRTINPYFFIEFGFGIIGKEGSTNRITLDYSTLILNGSNINIFESVYIKSTSSKIKIGENYVHGEDKIKIMIGGTLSTNFLLVQECSKVIKDYFEVISEDGEKTYTLSDEGYVSE